ncbi:MAG TPA: alpha/beta fold hydrolase, partial [Ktedonobacterales bacterium]|nr:alpha/beta fold hydrolase [Ktedonobacterales bacterium]
GSLGDESLNAYRAQVFLGEELAQAGFPTLRISYYGTGDSAGVDDEPGRFRAWIDSIIATVRWLRSVCGVTKVSLCGVRVGAVLAAQAVTELNEVDALILLLPINGHRFLREQVLTARTVAEIWQSSGSIEDGRWFEAYGLRLDLATRDALDALDIGKMPHLPVRRILLLDQPGTPGSHRLIARLRAQGIEVTHSTADGCERMLRDSHEADVPHAIIARIVVWLGDAARSGEPVCGHTIAPLKLGGVREIPVSLGPGDRLVGILALPKALDSTGPVVLIPSTGANPRFGTSRGGVALARWLAESGIASLRMDGHGIGDSAPASGELGKPYSKQGDQDVCAGVDFLAGHFEGPVVVLGMCSGAYHAFQAALVDQRIKGLILVNLQKFIWRGGESLSVVQRTTFRTTGFYLRNAVEPPTWRRLLQGQINVAGITRALASRTVRQLTAAADPAIAAVSGETPVGMVRRQLNELSQRSMNMLYVLSGNDPGLDEISEYFGVGGWRLRRNPMVIFRTLPGADHTLSAEWARHSLRSMIVRYFR